MSSANAVQSGCEGGKARGLNEAVGGIGDMPEQPRRLSGGQFHLENGDTIEGMEMNRSSGEGS
jgi:hypothetical protein